MAGPASPGTEGPTFEPPQLPPGWIAQWDGSSKKYYFVSISTGVSQWETPREAAATGTPAQPQEHPYGVPKPEIITHPDGTQTVRHADGRMEPVLPPGDGTRGIGGETSDRSIGSFAQNMLMNQLSGGKQSHNSGSSSSPLGGLASQLIGGFAGGSNHGNSQGSSHNSSSNNGAGKLVGALASSLFSSGGKTEHQQPQNYHGGQTSTPQQSGGFAGSVMGGVANMFGGNQGHSSQNYGYSNSGQSGGYSGQAPPTSYQPSGQPTAAYTSPPPASQHGQHSQHTTPSYGASAQQQAPSYAAPTSQHGAAYSSPPPGQQHQTYGQHSPAPQGQHYSHQPSYGSSGAPQHQAPYGGQHQQYPQSQPSYGQPQSQSGYGQQYGQGPPTGQPSYPSQSSYGHQPAPTVPSGSHPHYGQQSGHQGGYSGHQW